jgi:hypothetical protein
MAFHCRFPKTVHLMRGPVPLFRLLRHRRKYTTDQRCGIQPTTPNSLFHQRHRAQPLLMSRCAQVFFFVRSTASAVTRRPSFRMLLLRTVLVVTEMAAMMTAVLLHRRAKSPTMGRASGTTLRAHRHRARRHPHPPIRPPSKGNTSRSERVVGENGDRRIKS